MQDHQPSVLSVRELTSWAALLIGVLAFGIAASRAGGDYAPVHLTSVGVLTGVPIYDRSFQLQIFPVHYPGNLPQGMFYPPATGVALAPLGLLPYEWALVSWFALTLAALVLGVRSLVRALAPERHASVWRFAAAAVLASSALRWGLTPGQGAPLILGVTCLFVAALARGQTKLAIALATFALAFKFTLALPFLALLLLWRHFAGILVCLSFWLASNIWGMARVGGLMAFRQYSANIGLVEAMGDVNTPDPWELVSVPRTDLIYLFYGLLRDLPLSRVLTKVASGAVGLALVWLAFRIGPRPPLRQLFAYLLATTSLGLLVVYHHHYDLAVIIAPLLLLAVARQRLSLSRLDYALLCPLLIALAFLPIHQAQRLLIALLGPQGVAVLNFAFPLLTLAPLVVGTSILVSARHRALAADPLPS